MSSDPTCSLWYLNTNTHTHIYGHTHRKEIYLNSLIFNKIFFCYSYAYRGFSLPLCQLTEIDVQVREINNVTILESFPFEEPKALPNHFMSNN